MSTISVVSILSSASRAEDDVVRKSANFHPTVWGDYFLNYTFDDVAIRACAEEVEKLKEEVRNILKEVHNEPSKQLNLIDALQRLSISYHFETEIEEAMKQMSDLELTLSLFHHNDIHNVALCFRLLRQQGYDVSSDVFNKFKDDKGEFKSTLIDDVKGMLSLYEAAHIRFHGEGVLEEALIFTTTNLSYMMNSSTSFSCSPLGRQIKHSLDQPFHKAIPRLEARRYYISLYESENEKLSDSVTRLAKLDFQLVQALHRQELSDLSRWWKDLDLVSKLPFVRDRLVECYFWATAAYFEPSDSLSRVFLAKLVIFITLVDDIFDVYATFEELKLFMGAFERWDASSVNELPEYMKVCFQAILDEFEKLEEVMDKEGCSYHVHYCKEAMKELVGAYFVEAKWYSEGHIPKLEEYLSNGSKSAGYCLSLIASFVGKGKMITKEAFEWMRGAPKPLGSSGLMTRLLNDVASHQIEQQRGDVASAVECYMKEYGASEQEACDEIKKMIEEAWKDVNEGCFMTRQSRVLPWPLPLRIVSLTRTPNLIYKYDEDTYSHSTTRLKENVTLLYNP